MISFDTFTGQLHSPRSSCSSSSDDNSMNHSSHSGAKQNRRRAIDARHDAVALAGSSGDDEYEDARSEDSVDNTTGGSTAAAAADSCDLFHERTATPVTPTNTRAARVSGSSSSGRRSRRHSRRESAIPPPIITAHEHGQQCPQQRPPESGGRVLQLFHLLTFKNQASDAKSALVQRLIAITNVNDLIMSKATQEQIASAANDAITDEILASVDFEDKRRQSITTQLTAGQRTPSNHHIVALNQGSHNASALVTAGHYSPYRMLELVDVLDSTTGGMVKLILTNVRRRAPFSQRKSKAIEFCSLCSAYSDHTATQHRCRICGVAGQHRSKSCPRSASSPSSFTPPSRSKLSDPLSSGKSYCTFCSSMVLHTTQTHQCRNCGALGAHRSRSCSSAKVTGRGGSRWVGSPIEQLRERKFCDLCGAWRHHTSHEHKCSICSIVGEHRSKNCPMKASANSTNSNRTGTGGRTPRINGGSPATALEYCSFCSKQAAHRSEEHRCRTCQAVGLHRSGECPERKQSQSVLSYSVTTASKVFEKVLPSSATALVWDSIDKVGDVDTILKKTLQRIGVWGGGSQTPITTPYAPPVGFKSSRESGSSSGQKLNVPASVANAAGAYVLSYAEGHSVVPERILKYMRLLMHHEVSVNAFSVVVRFDPRSSHWELEKPGMVTPRSLPSSPTMSEQLKKRMAKYTLQTLLGAREQLVALVVVQRKQELQLLVQLQQQAQAQVPVVAHANGLASEAGVVAVESS
ncbi:hypothetical protein Gpo141_00002583 [Globisporangium polare]